MILNSTAENQAVLSNVGEIGEFRIRNSAKAFGILSSGLYANKIRAIIRELSCNAVDSHVAAGRADTPFDLHLPTSLEPHFAIRDYGTGLDHAQVTNIYTTYFESTKTDSNDFIGALGLGSKSPFSYTDNFTVTAIKNGRKGIYTAFINEQGVPSIALMMESASDDPSGVEVKFSVNDQNDFHKFRQEAQIVYTHFKLRPVVNDTGFQFVNPKYEERDIVPGIHYYTAGSIRGSVAVMGNIAYPIDVPNSDKVLGELRHLLSCGLEIHFEIGELDFQASREGLSYVPQTIESIRKRLAQLNDRLADHLQESADKIANFWERSWFLIEKQNLALWRAAVNTYAAKTKFPMMPRGHQGYMNFKLYEDELASKYNIAIRGFSFTTYNNVASTLKSYNDNYSSTGTPTKMYITVDSSKQTVFVINDTKVGALERAKYHYRNSEHKKNAAVYVLEAANKKLPVLTSQFLADMYDPPKVLKASELLKKETKQSARGQNVTILKLERRSTDRWSRRRVDSDMVWREAGGFKDFDAKATHYYVPINGFKVVSKIANNEDGFKLTFQNAKQCGLGIVKDSDVIYGVRKADLEFVKLQKNWVNFEDHIQHRLKSMDKTMLDNLASATVGSNSPLRFNKLIADKITCGTKSPFLKLSSQLSTMHKVHFDFLAIEHLCKLYAPSSTTVPTAHIEKIREESEKVMNRYPMLRYVEYHPYRTFDVAAVADYINMVDQIKGV